MLKSLFLFLRKFFYRIVFIQFYFTLSFPAYAQTSFSAQDPLTDGVILLGTSNDVCTPSLAGTIHWNNSNSCIELCDGLGWKCLFDVSCATFLPDLFSFNETTNHPEMTDAFSNIVEITGIGSCDPQVTISAGEYRICNDSLCASVLQDWTDQTTTIKNNKFIQLKRGKNVLRGGNRTFISYVIIGRRIASWTIKTAGNCADANPPLGTICADGSLFLGFSPDGNRKMYTTICRHPGRRFDRVSSCQGKPEFMELQWSRGNTLPSGANSFFDGESNTTTLALSTDADSPYFAAIYCYNLKAHGHDDWYLPSRAEGDAIRQACGLIFELGGCTNNDILWTSTRGTTAANAWTFRMNTTGEQLKLNQNNVRCIRKD